MARGDQEMLNVLVIDDDEAVRGLLVDIISREEHQAVAAESAEQGLELLPYWTFQVAFIDLHLPGMDGIVLGEYLRRNNPEMVIVIVSGDDTKQLERRSRDLSLRFLAKPFRVPDILGVLDTSCRAIRDGGPASSTAESCDFYPSLSKYYQDLPAHFSMPKVPARIEDRLITMVRRSLSDLGSAGRYSERDRVVALAGLVAAQVLGIQLPRTSAGATLFGEYDAIMKDRGKATAFENGELL